MADDAAAKARMMADLGIGRRDLVSAPEEDEKKKRRVPRHDLAQEQAEVQHHVNAHRARNAQVTAAAGDAKASKISAWNNPKSFDRDEVTEQLENRFEGQGHRYALKRKIGYDGDAEALQNQVGEERQLYLSERNLISSNRQAIAGPTKQERFFDHVMNRDVNQRDPRARRMVDEPSPRGRGKTPVYRTPNPNAAPAPVGRTRYVYDQVVSQLGPPQLPNATQSPGNAPQTHHHQQNVAPPMPAEGPKLFNPQQAEAVRRGQSPAKSTTSSTRTRSSRSKGFKNFTDTAKLEGFKALRMKTTTPNLLPALSNPAAKEVFRMKARWYAARPGLECDVYHEKFPERKPFLELAIKELIQEIFKILKDGDDRDMELYVETHPERKWMTEAAVQAKELVEHSSAGEIQAYCAEHPTQEDFVQYAASQFNPKPRQDSVMDVKANGATNAHSENHAAEPDTDAIMAHADEVSIVAQQAKLLSEYAQPTAARHVVETTPPYARSTPPHARNKRTTGQAALSSSPASAITEHKSAKIETEAETPVTTKEAQSVRYEAPQEASSSSPLPGAFPKAERVFSAANSAEDTAIDTTATSIEPEAPVLVKEVEKKGSLTATFFDIAGTFMKVYQCAIAAPVMANINIASRVPEFNPTDLIKEIESLAERMVERTNSSNGASGTKAVNGTKGMGLVAYDSDEEL